MQETTQSENVGMKILSILHRDHINMSKLLSLIEKNIELIKQGNTADLKLMAEAIEYIGHYADLYHHPLEDVLYSYFKGKSQELTLLINRCEKEHQDLKVCTEKVLSPLSVSLLDGMLPMQQIIEKLEAFLLQEKQHINFEEGQIFPKIEALASDKDWEQLAKESWLKTDAMFQKFDSNHYAELYQELEEAIAS